MYTKVGNKPVILKLKYIKCYINVSYTDVYIVTGLQ